jgi:hypothetical protein
LSERGGLAQPPDGSREFLIGTSLAYSLGSQEDRHMLSTTEWMVLLGVTGVAIIALVALIIRTRSKQHVMLKRRFGPEYDREVEQRGGVSRAERELLAREKRVHEQPLRALAEGQRIQFLADWRSIQARFVDDPSGAVKAANELIKAVMLARGYQVERFDQRVADLSVEHAAVVQHYRAAHELAEANREGRADTEELRQAVVHYRALFADLLEQPERAGIPEPHGKRSAPTYP